MSSLKSIGNKFFSTSFKTYKSDHIPKGIFKASIAPRPIGWISSVCKSGNHNLAPFSYFNAVCDIPPTIMISTTDQHIEGGPKDTLQNIESTGHFVVNIVTQQLYEQMNLTSADLPRHTSEFDYADIKWLKSDFGESRRVENSPIQFECKYFTSVQLPQENKTSVNKMIIGTVIAVHVDSNILDENGRVDYAKLKLIARMGYNDYLAINPKDIFVGKRPAANNILPKE
ncbi:MAG: flavin reductase family protein [Proteobacteria bacterium]|jgi:flavin reductase (DIM6/NTAB) family NADH-FMN oxidoreductase RutF|nr:flavin reductase family protein [Pseudomonadota bacterium]